MFYTTGVDIASVKSMWEFLHNHFQYSTLNSWNGLKSIAHNVKLYNLKLRGDWGIVLDYLNDDSGTMDLQWLINDTIAEFERHNPRYRVGFNGRSGGYLVLYNADNYRSILPDCLDYDSYEDFKEDAKRYGERVTDFMWELREAVTITRKFDRLCDALRDLVDAYSVRDFNTDKLEGVIESFNSVYGDDLDSLGFDGPELIDGKVRLNCLSKYQAFFDCFVRLFGDDCSRIVITKDREYLYLEER